MKLVASRSQGVRRLVRSRSALVALAVVSVYVAIALTIRLVGVVTLEHTEDRVGPAHVPGLFRSPDRGTRIEHCARYLAEIRGALAAADPVSALGSAGFAELRVADRPLAELAATVARADALVDDLSRIDDVASSPAAAQLIADLERTVRSLYRTPDGVSGAMYRLRLLLGTDVLGRSIALRGIYSIKVAVEIGVIAAFVSVLLGGLLGALAGFYGGWVDLAVSWLYSTFASIPYLVLMLVLVYVFAGSAVEGTLIPVYVALCLTFWIGPCRVIRGEAMKLRDLEYVDAARAIGLGSLAVLWRHVLPNTVHLLLVNFSLLFVAAIKSEVVLSFLGVGVRRGPSWGIMISQARHEVVSGFFWQIGTATGLMLILVLAFNVLADALQDALDPRHVR